MQRNGKTEFDEFESFQSIPECSVVHTLDFEYRCEYVRGSSECMSMQFYFNYIELIYCTLQPDSSIQQGLCIIGLIGVCLLMFLILGLTANNFFCPALAVVAKNLGLSEHVAGVTILAFGNGAPDLFVGLASYNDTSRTLFNDVYATAIYITAFVGGLVCALSPFKLSAYNTLRDVCFLFFSIIYVDYVIVSDNHVTILESISIISIYCVYIITVIVDTCLLKRVLKEMERKVQIEQWRYGISEHSPALARLSKAVNMEIVDRGGSVIDIEFRRRSSYNVNARKNFGLLQQFVDSIKPIDFTEYKKSGCATRAFLIFRTPFIFVLKWLLPVVDFELERHGWSKLLNSLQITIMPLVIFHSVYGLTYAYGVPSYVVIAVFTLPWTCYIFLTTRTDISPDYHSLFAVFSAMGCIFVIYTCACESVEILAVLGIISNRSQAFLGCTLLAWGNGIGDLVTNVSMANIGYQKMSYAACYGGPLFNSILVLGLANFFRSWETKEGYVTVNQGPMGENCIIFLMILCFSTLVWSTATNFNARRSIGIFSILVYLIFGLYVVMAEMELIQSFAPQFSSTSWTSS